MANNKEVTYENIISSLKNKQYEPIYYLMGEEVYFIDQISDYIENNVLTDSEKEFNQTIMYGADVDIAAIINAARRYPMMAEHQVIIVKEAQNISNIDALEYYLQKPMPSTILVICHKHGALDKRKKIAALIEKNGILFESKKIKDTQLPSFITIYLKRKGIDIEPKATAMLADFVGSDLSRLTGELDKLIITLKTNQKRITPEQVELNIGISKDYNIFELRNAIINKDIAKVSNIVDYFNKNQKTNPLQVTLSFLFSFFSNLMLAYYSPVRSEQGIAEWLNLRSSWQARDYMMAMNKYNGIKTMKIIEEIRFADAKSKGVNNTSTSSDEILRELLFKILH